MKTLYRIGQVVPTSIKEFEFRYPVDQSPEPDPHCPEPHDAFLAV